MSMSVDGEPGTLVAVAGDAGTCSEAEALSFLLGQRGVESLEGGRAFGVSAKCPECPGAMDTLSWLAEGSGAGPGLRGLSGVPPKRFGRAAAIAAYALLTEGTGAS